jgi:hypothetical protein
MRLISFSLTTRQVRESTPEKTLKDVTRRMGWAYLEVGERLMGCEKVMGRRNGEPLVRIREIEVVSVRREQLRAITDDPVYGASECRREGFPEMTPKQFVRFFCASHKGCRPEAIITRIEFKYVGGLVR